MKLMEKFVLPCFTKNFNKIIAKIHVGWKHNQTTNQIYNIQH